MGKKEQTKIVKGRVCAVMGFVLDKDNNLLLLQRKDNEEWEPIKGGMLKKENRKKAIVREVKEETNLDVEAIQEIGSVLEERVTSQGKTKIKGYVWLCRVVQPKREIILCAEHIDYKWVPLKSLQSVALYPPIANSFGKKVQKLVLH